MITPEAREHIRHIQLDPTVVLTWVLLAHRNGTLTAGHAAMVLGIEFYRFEALKQAIDLDWLVAHDIARRASQIGIGFITAEQVLYALRGKEDFEKQFKRLSVVWGLVDEALAPIAVEGE